MRGLMVMAIVGFILFASGPWQEARADAHYVSVAGSDSGDCTGAPCLTITYAVGQAASGDTVSIGAGVYNESVLVTKSLTLRGAGAGATIIDGTGLAGGSLPIFAGTLRALVSVNPPNAAGSPYLVRIEGVTIRNSARFGLGANGNGLGTVCLQLVDSSFFSNAYDHFFMNDVDASSGSPSLIQGNTFNGSSGSYLDGSDNVTIRGNVFIDTALGSDQGLGMQQVTGIIIEQNTFSGWDNEGVIVNATTNQPLGTIVIHDNVFSNGGGGTGHGILLVQVAHSAGFGSLSILGNRFFSNAGTGIVFSPGGYAQGDIAGVAIRTNQFVGNAGYAILNAGAGLLSAEYNWYGDCTGPFHPLTNAGGRGDAVSDGVDYSPWLGPCVFPHSRRLPSYYFSPLAMRRIVQAEKMGAQVESLLAEAEERGLDVEECRAFFKKGMEYLVRARANVLGSNFVAANAYALSALEEFSKARDCLATNLGLASFRYVMVKGDFGVIPQLPQTLLCASRM